SAHRTSPTSKKRKPRPSVRAATQTHFPAKTRCAMIWACPVEQITTANRPRAYHRSTRGQGGTDARLVPSQPAHGDHLAGARDPRISARHLVWPADSGPHPALAV